MKIPAIGDKIRCHLESKGRDPFTCAGVVVGFWPAELQPPGDEIVTFSKLDLNSQLAKAMWKSKQYDRIILKKINGSYVILPMSQRFVFEGTL